MAEKKKKQDEKPEEAPQPQQAQQAPLAQKSRNLIEEVYTGLTEKTESASPYVAASQLRPYNPDDLYQKRQDYGIYEEMMQDDQVSICMKLKKDMVLASGWDIVTEGEEDADTEIKEFLEHSLKESTESPFDDMLEEVLSAYEFGFSLSEKVFAKQPDGMLGLKYLRTRHPGTWLIHSDKHGIITKFEQLVEGGNIAIEPKSLVHYVNQPKFQNPYGTSDLRTAYNAWFTKRQIIRYLAIFLEKAAGPIPVAKYKTNAPKQAITDIHNAIKSFQNKTALTIPQDLEVEFLEAKNSGEAYTKAINLFNMFIGRALFVPDLIGFQGGETAGGAYALGTEHMKIFFKHIQRRRETLERVVNLEIIKPIVLFNFGDVEKYPKFKLRPIRDEDAIEFAKLWLEAVKGKVFKANEEEVNHFRKLTKFPEGEVEMHEPVQLGPDGQPLPPGQKPGMDPEDPKGKDEKEEQEPEEEKPIPAKKEFRAYAATPGSYARKVDFKAIETSMDRFKNRVLDQSAPVVKKVIKDLAAQIKRKRIVESQNAERIGGLKPKFLGEMRTIIKRNLMEAYQDAQLIAARELNKTNYAPPLPDEKFLKFLESETSFYVDDWAASTVRASKQILIKAIRDGKPLSSVLFELDEFGEAEATVSVERWARTKFTDVMNRGRLAHFEESGVVAAYQYSAILDDRTSEICSGLHGKIFPAGEQPIPPMHFNCRSLLVPITKYEEWEADKKVGSKSIDQFIEDNIGSGFSKYAAENHVESIEELLAKPDVTIESKDVDARTKLYSYARNGKVFYTVEAIYENEEQKVIAKLNKKDLRDAPSEV